MDNFPARIPIPLHLFSSSPSPCREKSSILRCARGRGREEVGDGQSLGLNSLSLSSVYLYCIHVHRIFKVW